VRFRRGDRIAQLVIQKVECPVFIEVTSLPGSERGDGGHGSTGGHAMAAEQQGDDEFPAATRQAGR
jgi:dUTP pyrophosphatase